MSLENKILDMDTLCQEMLKAEGDIALVAEKYLGSVRKTDEILAMLSADQGAVDAFQVKARAYTLIKSLQAFAMLHQVVLTSAQDLKPEAAVKAMIAMSTVMSQLTEARDTTNTQHNIFELIMRSVPAPVAAALQRAIQVQPVLDAPDVDIES